MGQLGGGDDDVVLLRQRSDALEAEVASLRETLTRERAEHAEALDRARLQGALRTARRVTHELRNVLSPVAGYGELLARRLPDEDAVLADRLKNSALRAADFLSRLDRIVRYREVDFGGETMLDLDEATAPQR
jgi:signal transduction histidine kinase